MFSPYIIGRHPVLEALESGRKIDKILLEQGVRGEVIDQIRQICRELQIPVQQVPPQKIDREVRGNHQGVAALTSAIEYYELQDVIDKAFEEGEWPLLVVLDEVTDVRNIGAIARTAFGLGANGIVIPQKGSAPIQADAIKASAGALLKIPVCKVSNLAVAIKDIKLNGFAVAGIHAHTQSMIENIEAKQPLAIVLGAEDTGISPPVQKEVQSFFKIPIQGIESYNVSVAAAMTLYQVSLNRKA